MRRICALLLGLVLLYTSAFAMSKEELRTRFAALEEAFGASDVYACAPSLDAMQPGEISEIMQSNALDLVNFLRGIASLEPVQISPLYALRSSCAALVLATNDELTHTPALPASMDTSLYECGYAGASRGNIACFEASEASPLPTALLSFARDDGANNLSTLGHRRWLLNPRMLETGFGLAQAMDGTSYVCMYAADDARAGALPPYVAWPCGTFPVELMQKELAWSLSLSPEHYKLDGMQPRIVLTEQNSGTRYSFDPSTGEGDGYCRISLEPYGTGACLIFRPSPLPFAYEQNQRWTVDVTGLEAMDGSEAQLCFDVDMVSLYPQSVSGIELSPLSLSLRPGESIALKAQVIPVYADDTSVRWSSSNPAVAQVDANGMVTALASGNCIIIASASNGEGDSCALEVQ